VTAAVAALHARSVPLDYGPDALEFDGSPTVLFDRPGLTLVGWGTALLVPAAEAAAALAAIPCDDEVGTLGSGPVALGALPFHDTFAGHLVVPRFTMGTSRDADGVTRRWATAVGPADVALPSTSELFDAVIWQYGTTPATQDTADADPAAGAGAGLADLSTLMGAAGYAAMVKDAVALMAQPEAVLRKVVLSRPIEVRLRGQLALSNVLRRLRAGEPNCTIFSMPVPDGSFFGASDLEQRASFTAYAIAAPQNLARVESDLREEIARARREPFTTEEVAAAKSGFRAERELRRTRDGSLAVTLAHYLYTGRTFAWDEELEAKVEKLTPAELQSAVERRLDPAHLVVMKAGDFAHATAKPAATPAAATGKGH